MKQEYTANIKQNLQSVFTEYEPFSSSTHTWMQLQTLNKLVPHKLENEPNNLLF